ncbi:MAG: four helix bundle protein [bacterium]|nr:four helix bundle protein [bacterium]
MLVGAKKTYRLWHDYLVNLKRLDSVTIGEKIDNTFLTLLELIFKGCFATDKFEKLSFVSLAIGKCDILKFFLQISWEHKIIDHKKYGELILELDHVGRMLGGWKKNIQEKTPPTR